MLLCDTLSLSLLYMIYTLWTRTSMLNSYQLCVYIYIYMHIYIYMYTYTYIYTHTHYVLVTNIIYYMPYTIIYIYIHICIHTYIMYNYYMLYTVYHLYLLHVTYHRRRNLKASEERARKQLWYRFVAE